MDVSVYRRLPGEFKAVGYFYRMSGAKINCIHISHRFSRMNADKKILSVFIGENLWLILRSQANATEDVGELAL
jgi:hypothetical protein